MDQWSAEYSPGAARAPFSLFLSFFFIKEIGQAKNYAKRDSRERSPLERTKDSTYPSNRSRYYDPPDSPNRPLHLPAC